MHLPAAFGNWKACLVVSGLLLGGLLVAGVSTRGAEEGQEQDMEKATFGAGCFWCVEAVFKTLPGVKSVTWGYAGGTTKKPSYEDVCTGKTGHAEVV